MKVRLGGVTLTIVVMAAAVRAQGTGPGKQKLTLRAAIDFALTHYPAVQAAIERMSAARGQIGLARTAYLPSLDALWQANRATDNNINGLLLPQQDVPPISGPVLAKGSGRSAWGSAAGVLLSWQPFDFGYRGAELSAARAAERGAQAHAALTRLGAATAVSGAFFSLLEAEQVEQAAHANMHRWTEVDASVRALVAAQLRPGVEAARADAELALARNQWIQAQTEVDVGRAALAETLGAPGAAITPEPGPLLGPAPAPRWAAPQAAAHPEALALEAQVAESESQQKAVARSYAPAFALQGAVSGRGSGIAADGSLAGGAEGLGLQRDNWAVGLTVSFPVFGYFAQRDRKRIATAETRGAQARYRQGLDDLASQAGEAEARLRGARRVADNTPTELAAARQQEMQARVRYRAGLASIVEVAEAEGLLAQAEVDDATARLRVWRALEEFAAAAGSLQPFENLLGPGGR